MANDTKTAEELRDELVRRFALMESRFSSTAERQKRGEQIELDVLNLALAQGRRERRLEGAASEVKRINRLVDSRIRLVDERYRVKALAMLRAIVNNPATVVAGMEEGHVDVPSNDSFDVKIVKAIHLGFLQGVGYANRHWLDGDGVADDGMLYCNFCESDESDIPDLAKTIDAVNSACDAGKPASGGGG